MTYYNNYWLTEATEKILDGLLDLAGKHAHMCLVQMKAKALVPSWVLINDKGEFRIIGTPFEDEQRKRREVSEIRALMRSSRVIAYSFVGEAWMARVNCSEVDLEKRAVRDPADKPVNRVDRREVVSAIAATKAALKCAQWEIMRGPLGEVEALIALPIGQKTDSWLGELLR